MDHSLLTSLISGRELLLLGTGAASLGIGATLLHIKGNLNGSRRLHHLVTSLAVALFVSGAILAHSGF